ncbi:RagB/SusD family nutrient uptake outer membrane protein [Echinicola pacifica]|nr:RagB/SusD family nutrient uptake outer membrane protein [Echinicola pacifica]
MKKLKHTYIMVICLLCLACNQEFLDKNPNDALSADSFWSNEYDAIAGLTAIYDALETGNESLGWATLGLFDLFTPLGNSRNGVYRQIAEGVHNPDNRIVNELWENMYKGVVRSNDFLVHIDEIPFEGENGEERKNIMIGEARFLRAMYYYLLVEVYGDVPLFITVPTAQDADAYRAPVSEVVELMKEDLLFAVDHLPVPGQEQTGRATKGAALALRMKIGLFEKDWAAAATAAEQIMSMGYSLVPNYEDVISTTNENNEEVIFDVEHIFRNESESGGNFEKMYAFRSASADGWSWMQPTSWYVDQFERIIQNPVEGVDYINEDPDRIPDDVYAYFEGRDPRLDHTILRPGSHFKDKLDDDILYPHDFQAVNHSQVGMHMRKYVIPGAETSQSRDSPLDYIIFRYADVLLNYLEAVAMRDGGAETVSQAILDQTINSIRSRASEDLPLYTAGAITMADIYRERMVELSMEGWSFFDMRRNSMIEINEGFGVYGLTVDAGNTVDFNPNIINQVRIFDPAMHYLWPIPTSELERGKNLTQNPGYPE